MDETIIDIDVANTLRILSAYFTATATIRPPKAYINKKLDCKKYGVLKTFSISIIFVGNIIL